MVSPLSKVVPVGHRLVTCLAGRQLYFSLRRVSTAIRPPRQHECERKPEQEPVWVGQANRARPRGDDTKGESSRKQRRPSVLFIHKGGGVGSTKTGDSVRDRCSSNSRADRKTGNCIDGTRKRLLLGLRRVNLRPSRFLSRPDVRQTRRTHLGLLRRRSGSFRLWGRRRCRTGRTDRSKISVHILHKLRAAAVEKGLQGVQGVGAREPIANLQHRSQQLLPRDGSSGQHFQDGFTQRQGVLNTSRTAQLLGHR